MNIIRIFLLIVVFAIISMQCEKNKSLPYKEKLSDKTDTISYVIGLDIGNYFRAIGKDIDMSAFVRGVENSLSGEAPIMAESEIGEVKMQIAKDFNKQHNQKKKESK